MSVLPPAPDLPFAELLAFTRELAQAAAAEIRPLFGAAGLAVELKADDSPVTLADRRAEEVMRARIARRYPAHGILGEEFGAERPGAEFTWVLDPIDGTKAFAAACPLFGTLIGLLHHGRPVLGCIHLPVTGQLLMGDGRETTLDGRPVRARTGVPLDRAVVLFSDPVAAAQHQDGAAFDRLIRRARVARTWGDCYGYHLVCTGWADAMLDPVMHPWDLLPLLPVCAGAGVTVTTWQGGDAAAPGAASSIAAPPALHAEVLATLQR